ncbi:aldo/keto reductase [Actinomadura fulvescens]|uniref:Aldo/keto reductase n=1 Tax=Actinomadura fulvescens TaxID=46160 RepID=A0ABN3PCD5_9ACTN
MNIALGTIPFGTTLDDAASFAVLDRFHEAGGSMIDTANCYSFWHEGATGGESEALIGRWLAARGVRDDIVLGTKAGAQPKAPGTGLENAEGLSAKAIRAAAEASLRRLGTDHIDVYWAHLEDRTVPLEETMGAFGELVANGDVGRLGVSNHAVWRVERARALGRPGYTELQYRYSYLLPRPGIAFEESAHYHANDELFDYARAEGLTLWAYTALINGAYTRADRPLHAAYDHPGTAARLAALRAVAGELGATPNQVVLAWLMGGDHPITPIVGVSSVAQLDELLPAADLKLDAELRERLDTAG